jgi:hypothetical protein
VFPLAVLLAFTAVVAIAMMLRQQGQLRLAAEQQVDAYVRHHVQMGLALALSVNNPASAVRQASRRDNGAAPDEPAPDPDAVPGEVTRFSILTMDGSRVDFLVLDEQGRALDAPDHFEPLIADVALTLGERTDADNLLRDRGPATVSVVTAPYEVLRAVAQVAIVATESDADPGKVADALIEAREARKVTTLDQVVPALTAAGCKDLCLQVLVGRSAAAAGAASKKPAAAGTPSAAPSNPSAGAGSGPELGLLTATPSLLRVEVAATTPRGVVAWRKSGLILVASRGLGGASGRSTPVFLEWEDVPAAEEARGLDRPRVGRGRSRAATGIGTAARAGENRR